MFTSRSFVSMLGNVPNASVYFANWRRKLSKDEHPDALELIGYARVNLERKRMSEVGEHCRTCVDCGDQLAAIMLLREREGLDAEASASWPAWLLVIAALTLLGWFLLS